MPGKIILILVLIVSTSRSNAQDPMRKIAKSYFQTHPFDQRFSSFIHSLQQDLKFTIQQYDKRTDSSFFYLTGIYRDFNPFRYKSQEVRLIVAEEEFIHPDSLQTLDTIINLQIMGISAAIDNEILVKKEFSRFHDNTGIYFYDYIYKEINKDQKITGQIYNYFIFPYNISPVTIAWGHLPGSQQYTFTITIRFKLIANEASLILSSLDLKNQEVREK